MFIIVDTESNDVELRNKLLSDYKMKPKVKCPYCNGNILLEDSSYVYGGRDTGITINICENYPDCDSYGSTTLANKELRELRKRCHHLFDSYWKDKKWSRTEGYEFLSKVMDIPKKDCHIALFNIELCNKLIEAFGEKRDELVFYI